MCTFHRYFGFILFPSLHTTFKILFQLVFTENTKMTSWTRDDVIVTRNADFLLSKLTSAKNLCWNSIFFIWFWKLHKLFSICAKFQVFSILQSEKSRGVVLPPTGANMRSKDRYVKSCLCVFCIIIWLLFYFHGFTRVIECYSS